MGVQGGGAAGLEGDERRSAASPPSPPRQLIFESRCGLAERENAHWGVRLQKVAAALHLKKKKKADLRTEFAPCSSDSRMFPSKKHLCHTVSWVGMTLSVISQVSQRKVTNLKQHRVALRVSKSFLRLIVTGRMAPIPLTQRPPLAW